MIPVIRQSAGVGGKTRISLPSLIKLPTSQARNICRARCALTKKVIGKTKINKLSVLRLIRQPKINFVSFRKYAYIISIAVIVVGLFSFQKRGEGNYGIDFTGGTIQQFRFERPVEAQDIRNVLKDIGLGSASIQHFGNKREVIIRSFEMDPERIIDEFRQVFKENKFEYRIKN